VQEDGPALSSLSEPPGTVRQASKLIVGFGFAAVLSTSGTARADGEDSFWGRDKALHFAAAGTIAGGGYALGTAIWPERWKALALGGAAAVGAGALKEGLDAAGLGDPSWKDFAWDVIGAACGLGVAFAIDVGAHGGTATIRF
jgi:putative lipoprotein